MITTIKPLSKTIELTLNGFYGFNSHKVKSVWTQISDDAQGEALEYQVEITESAARKFACRSSDCSCGEGVPTSFTADGYDFEAGVVQLNGNYPQR